MRRCCLAEQVLDCLKHSLSVDCWSIDVCTAGRWVHPGNNTATEHDLEHFAPPYTLRVHVDRQEQHHVIYNLNFHTMTYCAVFKTLLRWRQRTIRMCSIASLGFFTLNRQLKGKIIQAWIWISCSKILVRLQCGNVSGLRVSGDYTRPGNFCQRLGIVAFGWWT